MKETLKRLIFGPRRIAQWCAIGIEDPSRLFRLSLEDGEGLRADVTKTSSVAALRPVTFAIRAGDGNPRPALEKSRVVLRVHPPTAEDWIGEITLRFVRDVGADAARISLFTASGHRNRSLPPADYRRFRLRQRWEMFRDRTPYNFRMIPAELFALYVFYYVPRPVHLVSVAFEGASNIFPMDLVGRMGDDLFLLALRSTSPAIRLMTGSKRLAVTAVPFDEKDVAYRLGTHHKKETIDWEALPFQGIPSPAFGLRVPASALGVREVEVVATELVGTHVLFVTRIVREETWRRGRSLCHIPGILREYLTRIAPSAAAGLEIEGLS
jgi:flavin reductase (DIM6/NTAB) family NADH-FMN oxidoreductase RutF